MIQKKYIYIYFRKKRWLNQIEFYKSFEFFDLWSTRERQREKERNKYVCNNFKINYIIYIKLINIIELINNNIYIYLHDKSFNKSFESFDLAIKGERRIHFNERRLIVKLLFWLIIKKKYILIKKYTFWIISNY